MLCVYLKCTSCAIAPIGELTHCEITHAVQTCKQLGVLFFRPTLLVISVAWHGIEDSGSGGSDVSNGDWVICDDPSLLGLVAFERVVVLLDSICPHRLTFFELPLTWQNVQAFFSFFVNSGLAYERVKFASRARGTV